MFVAYVIVVVVLSAGLLAAAFAKLTRKPNAVATLSRIHVPGWMITPLAVIELVAVVGLVIGFWLVPIGVAAAIGLIVYFAGAVTFRVMAGDHTGYVAPALLLLLAVLALIFRIASA
jgi:hypothetical protein